MKRGKMLISVFLLFWGGFSQSPQNFTGTVVDPAGEPVEGAVVTVLRKNVSEVTGSDGTFDLGNVPVVRMTGIPAKNVLSIRGSVLSFGLQSPQKVGLTLHTLQGQKVAGLPDRIYDRGMHTIDLKAFDLSSRVYIVGLHVGDTRYHCRSIGARLSAPGFIDHSVSTAGGAFANAGVWIDSLKVTHPSYRDQQIPLADYRNGTTVTLYPAGNTAPVIRGVNDVAVYAWEKLSFQVDTEDPDGNDVMLTADNLPSNAQFVDGLFTWQTTRDDTGSHEIGFTADDGTEHSRKNITIDVTYAEVDTCNRMRILRPNGGEIYHIGDTMTITWAINKERGVDKGVRVLISLYAGAYDAPSFNETGFRDDSAGIYTGNIGTYEWVVAPTLTDEKGDPFSIINDRCVIQVWGDYQPNECNGRLYTNDASDGVFSIRE
ncbi:MAG: hypothetical protein GF401_00890 [Chitinivibrionales bacterium]|nr:hypothetical protein [Chitinivibrionales bacterium]